MLFRPEEIHPPSAERHFLAWTGDGTVRVGDHRIGFDAEDLLVAHLDHQRLSAVQAWRIDANGLVGK
jgi:hypothetical protein